jgi:hypothetical protein
MSAVQQQLPTVCDARSVVDIQSIKISFDSVTPGFRGQTRVHLKCVLGSSLTHMMTHGIETNVTSLLYSRSSVHNS